MNNKLTVADIKEKLNELGVEFDDKLNKDGLLELLKSQVSSNDLEDEDSETNQVNESETKKYVVVHDFKDLRDGNTIYIKGDIYPRRAGATVDEERIAELSSTKNKQKKVLIKEQG